MELNENKTTAPVETVENKVYEKYERYQKIADTVIELLQQYNIRYDEMPNVQTYIKANFWKRALTC